FPDGLSHTAAYSERLRGTGSSSRIVPERDLGDLTDYPFADERGADYALSWCRVAGVNGFPGSRKAGFTWFFADYECTSYNHAQEPNGRIPDATKVRTVANWGIVTA